MGKVKQKFYTVWKGRKVGVFASWEECKAQIDHFEGAQYKSFLSKEEAEKALKQSYWNVVASKGSHSPVSSQTKAIAYIRNSIAVDAACSGNPGKMEYRGVMVDNRTELFHEGPFEDGTNNIGEFLAIVDGFRYLMDHPSVSALYSDSAVAIKWVKDRKCRTKLVRTEHNDVLFQRIEEAEQWLMEHPIRTPLLKWETTLWGEIPADFGRK